MTISPSGSCRGGDGEPSLGPACLASEHGIINEGEYRYIPLCIMNIIVTADQEVSLRFRTRGLRVQSTSVLSSLNLQTPIG